MCVAHRSLVMNPTTPIRNQPPTQLTQTKSTASNTHTHTQWASRLVADLELPGGPHGRRAVEARVAQSIREQLAAYDYALGMGGGIGGSAAAPASVLAPLSLRVRAAGLVYEDTVEWDVLGGEAGGSAPEAFAMRTVADLGLPPEFEPAIALSLREQILAYREVRGKETGQGKGRVCVGARVCPAYRSNNPPPPPPPKTDPRPRPRPRHAPRPCAPATRPRWRHHHHRLASDVPPHRGEEGRQEEGGRRWRRRRRRSRGGGGVFGPECGAAGWGGAGGAAGGGRDRGVGAPASGVCLVVDRMPVGGSGC